MGAVLDRAGLHEMMKHTHEIFNIPEDLVMNWTGRVEISVVKGSSPMYVTP